MFRFNQSGKLFKVSLVCQIVFCFCATSLFAQEKTSPVSGFAVLELFTSQGDINSAEADKILSEISAEAEKSGKKVYSISQHVDFWNRLGWKDPFSSFRHTKRLQNYTSVLKIEETYTPFFLVNGEPVSGDISKKTVNDAVSKMLGTKPVFNPEFTYEIFSDTLDLMYDLKGDLKLAKKGSESYINVVITETGLSTKVTKGDNAGKTLRNDYVSRLFYTTNLQTSKGLLRIPLRGLKPGKNKHILLFIQDKQSRKITGAVRLEFGS
jgi:hypothetical protein